SIRQGKIGPRYKNICIPEFILYVCSYTVLRLPVVIKRYLFFQYCIFNVTAYNRGAVKFCSWFIHCRKNNFPSFFSASCAVVETKSLAVNFPAVINFAFSRFNKYLYTVVFEDFLFMSL